MELLLRLLVPVLVVLVVLVLVWVGRAMLEGAREGVDEARQEEAQANAIKAAAAQQEAEARRQRFEAAAAALAPTDRFALNLRAPFTEIWLELFPHEGDDLDLEYLYRLTPPAGQEGELRKSLEAGWDITDHASAMHSLAGLLDTGHRHPYEQVRQALASGSDLKGLTREASVVRKWEAQVGGAGAAAFDLARAVDVAAQAHALGYLTEAQCWRVLRQCRTLALDTFQNWETYGSSFLAGAEFWKSGGLLGGAMHKRYAQSVRWLLENPDSPWVRDPWPARPEAVQAEREVRVDALN